MENSDIAEKTGHFIRENFLLIAATLAASAIHYLYQFSMGRLLGPADYGTLAALFSIIYISVAPVQAVQLTLTKFVAEFKASGQAGFIGALFNGVIKKLTFVGFAAFAVLSILSPWISEFLNIPHKSTIINFSFIFLAMFILAAARGFLQGMQRFKALGANLIAESATKLAFGLALVFAGHGILGAIWGANISVFVSVGLAAFILLPTLRARGDAITNEQRRKIYEYSIPTLIALSVVTALYSLDVLLVKHFFTPNEAGIYAAAALVSKVIFFALLPISQVMFPKVAELRIKGLPHTAIFLKSLALVTLLSAIAVATYFLAPSFVLNFLFGSEYSAAVPLIGLFGAAIALLSISYVFVNYFLSSGRTKFVYALPVFALAEVLLILFWHSSLHQIVTVLIVLMALLLAFLIALAVLPQKSKNHNS